MSEMLQTIMERRSTRKYNDKDEQIQDFLQKIPVSLQRTQEYEQQSLLGML